MKSKSFWLMVSTQKRRLTLFTSFRDGKCMTVTAEQLAPSELEIDFVRWWRSGHDFALLGHITTYNNNPIKAQIKKYVGNKMLAFCACMKEAMILFYRPDFNSDLPFAEKRSNFVNITSFLPYSYPFLSDRIIIHVIFNHISSIWVWRWDNNMELRSRLKPGIILGIIIFRILNALIVRTYFNPDEYWQGPEVAHVLVFGTGML